MQDRLLSEEAKLWNAWFEILCFDFHSELQQQLDEVTSKVQVLQDELSVLHTYINGQYPEQAVQIALLQRSIQKLKEQQQVPRPLLQCCQGGGRGKGRKERDGYLA